MVRYLCLRWASSAFPFARVSRNSGLSSNRTTRQFSAKSPDRRRSLLPPPPRAAPQPPHPTAATGAKPESARPSRNAFSESLKRRGSRATRRDWHRAQRPVQEEAISAARPAELSLVGTIDPESPAGSADPPPGSAEARQISEFFKSGGGVALITGEELSDKTALLKEVARLFGGPTLQVANPLVTPLSLTRMIVQIGAFDDGEDDAAVLRAHIAEYAVPGEPVLLAIDDSHTLDDEALSTVTSLASQPMNGAPVLVLMAGQPIIEDRVLSLLDASPRPVRVLSIARPAPDLATSAPVLQRSPVREPGSMAPAMPLPPPPLRVAVRPPTAPTSVDSNTEEPRPARSLKAHSESDQRGLTATPSTLQLVPSAPTRRTGSRGSLMLLALVGFAAIVTAGVMVASQRDVPASSPTVSVAAGSSTPPNPKPAVVSRPASPEPAAAVPEVSPPNVAPAPAIPEPTPGASSNGAPGLAETPRPRSVEKSDALLRRDFQSFLARTGRSIVARDPAKFEALFQDYLRWRSRDPSDGLLPAPR